MNAVEVLATARDLLRSVCRCGHLSSDHLLTERLQHGKCDECACRRFEPAQFDVWLKPVTATRRKKRSSVQMSKSTDSRSEG